PDVARTRRQAARRTVRAPAKTRGDRRTRSVPMPETASARDRVPGSGSTVLGLDVGDARIGVAVGRVGSRLAFGRGAIERRGTRSDVEAVLATAAAEGA